MQFRVTLDGRPAKISGAKQPFALVRTMAGDKQAEWSWDAVKRIVSAGGAFKTNPSTRKNAQRKVATRIRARARIAAFGRHALRNDSRPFRAITEDDVGKRRFRAFGRSWRVEEFIGRIMPQDVGKRVVLVAPDMVQVESDEQRRRRMKGRTYHNPRACKNPRHRHRRNPNGELPTPPPEQRATILSGPEQVAAGRMIALKGALRLELVGLKRRGPSAFSIVKREFGLKGSKQAVFEKFSKMVEDVIEHRAKPPGFNRNAVYKRGKRFRLPRRFKRETMKALLRRRARRNHAGLSGLMNAAEAKRALRFS